MSHTNCKTRKGRILSVRVERRADTNTDAAHLGTYSNNPGPAGRTIDREKNGDRGRGEYRYFIAAMSADETGNPESVKQDYARMEALNRGEWSYVGVIAASEVTLPGSDVSQKIRSSGLWGIESDSGADYFAEVEEQELDALRGELAAAGFGPRQIEHAFRKVARFDW